MKFLKTVASMRAMIKEKGGPIKSTRTALRVFRHHGIQGLQDALIRPPAWHALPIGSDYAVEVPFQYVPPPRTRRVCAIVHAYYPELCLEIREYLENIPGDLDVYISTTSPGKRDEISHVFEGFNKGKVEIRIFENRGRDIAPKLVGFKDVYALYDFALSLHTKKSPHGGTPLENWRHYLYENLLGSSAIVSSIFELLEHDRVGLVFPQHFPYLRSSLGWGANFPRCRRLLKKMGLKLSPGASYDFPSGSMFWCRTKALTKLLSLNLDFKDFDDEAGQIDGTLAHAIERMFLFAVEGSGYTWAKISRPDLYPLQSAILPVHKAADLPALLPRVHRSLLRS